MQNSAKLRKQVGRQHTNHMKQWHIEFVCLVGTVGNHNIWVGMCKLKRLRMCNKQVSGSIVFVRPYCIWYFLCFQIFDKSICYCQPMKLCLIELSIDVVDITRQEWYISILSQVSDCIVCFDTQLQLAPLYQYYLSISLSYQYDEVLLAYLLLVC